MTKLTWADLTPVEQAQCEEDITQSAYDLGGSEEYATAKDLWIRGYQRAYISLSTGIAKTIRQAADEIEQGLKL